MKKFVHWRSKWSISALCPLNTISIKWGNWDIWFRTTTYLYWKMASIYDLHEIMKVVYWRPNKRRYVTNICSKHESRLLAFVIFSCWKCARNTTSDMTVKSCRFWDVSFSHILVYPLMRSSNVPYQTSKFSSVT